MRSQGNPAKVGEEQKCGDGLQREVKSAHSSCIRQITKLLISVEDGLSCANIPYY
jgi:hypothetical protein